MSDIPIVDAHHHFWDLDRNYHPWLCDEPMIPFRYGDYSALRTSFMPDDYRKATGKFTVVKNVTVEAEWDPRDPIGETRWIHEVAKTNGVPHAHVAQIWLDQDDVEDVLRQQASFPLVRSVRHKPSTASRPDLVEHGAQGSLTDPRFQRGFRMLSAFGLRFDLQAPWWHLREALELAEQSPETSMVLNHTGLPADRSPEALRGWKQAMREFSSFPNAYVKISGLGLPGRRWSVTDNRPIILETIDALGVDRCMFASNFPVDSLVADFETIYDGFFESVSGFSDNEKRMLFHDNAIGVYALSEEFGPAAELNGHAPY